MRLATYQGSDGEGRSAVVVNRGGEDVVIDLNEASGGKLHHSLIHILREGDAALDEARRIAGSSAQGKPLSSVTLLAPLTRPGKLICIAGNFQKHIEEGGGQRVDKNVIVPKLFIKPSSSIIGPGAGRDAAPGRRELDRLGARARGRDRQARPRHPVRAGARLRRRLLGDQRHQRPVDGLERRGAQPRAASTPSSTGSTASGSTASPRGARGSPRPTRSRTRATSTWSSRSTTRSGRRATPGT